MPTLPGETSMSSGASPTTPGTSTETVRLPSVKSLGDGRSMTPYRQQSVKSTPSGAEWRMVSVRSAVMTPTESQSRMQSVRSEASAVHATGSANSRVLEILRSGSELSRWSPMSPSRLNTTLDTLEEEEERRTEMETLMWYYGLHSDQLNEELHPEHVSVERAAKERRGIALLFLKVSSSPCFRWSCFGVIAANTIFMGVQANAVAMGELDDHPAYRNLEITFVLWFIVESIIRYLGGTMSICQDLFLQFDIVVIGITSMDIFVLTPAGLLKDWTWSGSFFVVFRVLRLARVVKLVRVVGIFQCLQNMLHAVWFSKINFICVIVLLTTVSFITSLILMSLVGPVSGLTSDEVPEDILVRFSSVQRSMVTLFESLLQGEEWGKHVLRPLLNNNHTPLAGVIFGAFGSFGQFCIMNLVSGLFIEQMFKTVKLNNETQEHENIYLDQNGAECLKRVFHEIGNGRRALTWKQFSEGLVRHPDVVMQLGVNLELANALFNQLALDSSDVVDIDEFVFGMIKLTRQSKTIDMLVIDYQQQRAQKDVSRLSNRFRRDVERLQATLEHLAKHLSEILTDCQPLRSTLKGRLKRHIRRVSRQTSSAKTLTWGSTAESSDAGSSISKMPAKSPSPNLMPLKPWLQLLETEGRPRMRQELAALLASTAAPDASANVAPAAVAAPPRVRKMQEAREQLPPPAHDLPLSCLTQVPSPNLGAPSC